jgi:RNA polymerase-binding transcription factor DksA
MRGYDRTPDAQQCARAESAFLDEVCSVLEDLTERAQQMSVEANAQLRTGTYGFCMDCHEKIPASRLEECRSFAVRCAECDRARSEVDASGARRSRRLLN